MSQSTRRMSPILVHDRWLYRKDGNDYGPLSTDELLAAISDKKVDLKTHVCSLATGRWQTAAEHALLRDFYDKCVARWKRDEFHSEADAHVSRLARRRAHHTRLWVFLTLGIIVALAFGGWLVWRLTQAEPLGIETVARVPRLGSLPALEVSSPTPPTFAAVVGTKVRRLSEPETYDTAGVGFEGDGAVPRGVTKLNFGEDGRVKAISQVALNKVVSAAKRGLHTCARTAAKKDRNFRGTDVGFTVEPAKITNITVGSQVKDKPAFRACVKSVLRNVSVPMYEGSARRVTVPLKIAW